MYIKYLNQIYNLKKIIHISGPQNEPQSIILHKQDGYMTMKFSTNKIRNILLNEIWVKIKGKEVCFDIDEYLSVYVDADKYNIV